MAVGWSSRDRIVYLHVCEPPDRQVLVGPGGVEHDAAAELVAARLLAKPPLEAGLGGELA